MINWENFLAAFYHYGEVINHRAATTESSWRGVFVQNISVAILERRFSRGASSPEDCED